jgi:hypothetical protein
MPQHHQLRQMVAGRKSISNLVFHFQEFAKQRLLVRVEGCEVSNPSLLMSYLPYGDCTYDKQRQHSPNCDRHHDYVESRDRLKSLELGSKRIDHHREQKVLAWKVELNGDMEFEQI